MPFTTHYENQILSVVMAKPAQMNTPSMVYIGLCINDPAAFRISFATVDG